MTAEKYLGTPLDTANYVHYEAASMVGMAKYLNNISIMLVHGTEDLMVPLYNSMVLAKVGDEFQTYS